MRPDRKLWLIVPLLCVSPLRAGADDGEEGKLIAECSAAGLPKESLDSCLERVRVLEETDASSELQTLEANLEQRESGRAVRTQAAAAPAPRTPEPNEVAEEGTERRQSSLPRAELDNSARSGAAVEDEPPIYDSPDSPTDPGTDGANDSPQA